MANSSQLFKDDEQEQVGVPSDDELRHLTGISREAETAMEDQAEAGAREDLAEREHGFYNPGGDGTGGGSSNKVSDKSTLRDAEDDADSDGGDNKETTDGFYNPRGDGRRRRTKRKGLAHKKWLLLGASGGGGLFVVLLLLLILAGSLKIPDLAQNIVTYEFARLTRQFSQSAERSSEEELAVETTDQTTFDQLKATYGNLRDSTWGRLDRYRPSKVMDNLESQKGLKIVTKNTPLGRTVIDHIELDGKSYPIEQVGGIQRFIPGIRQLAEFKNNVAFAKEFAPDLTTAMDANIAAPIVRGSVAKALREKLGIGLVAWRVGEYKGKNAQQAEDEMNRDAYQAINDQNVDSTGEPALDSAESQLENKTNQDVGNDSALQKIEQNGGVDAAANAQLDAAVGSTSVVKDVVGAINPIYSLALPACIIYQGSLDKSGPTVDAQTAEQQRAFYFVASAADEQKAGVSDPSASSDQALAIGAMNQKTGDITQANSEIRASGGSVDTSTTLSSEASAMGDFTLFDATPGIGGTVIASLMNSIGNSSCSTLTNIWTAAGIGVLTQVGTLFADVFTGGGASAGEAAAEGATDAAVDEAAQTITQRFVSAITEKFAGKSVGDYAAKVREIVSGGVKSGVKLAGLTILAKLIVMGRAHQFNNGLEQDSDFDNEADAGGNINANELERVQLFGRPLLQPEVCSSTVADKAYVAANLGQQSAFSRYLSTSNAASLLSRSAIAVGGLFGTAPSTSLAHFGSLLASPSKLFGSLFGNLLSGPVLADNCPDSSTLDYGNVQFGWSDSEESLIDSSDSYKMLENQQVLDNSGQEGAIAAKYATCFGYTYNASGDGNFDPTDPSGDLQLADGINDKASLGTLLAHGDIVRDNNGNVINGPGGGGPQQPYQALCSPGNLDQTNNGFGPQMVFRWRLAMQYDTTVNQLTNMQSVNN